MHCSKKFATFSFNSSICILFWGVSGAKRYRKPTIPIPVPWFLQRRCRAAAAGRCLRRKARIVRRCPYDQVHSIWTYCCYYNAKPLQKQAANGKIPRDFAPYQKISQFAALRRACKNARTNAACPAKPVAKAGLRGIIKANSADCALRK